MGYKVFTSLDNLYEGQNVYAIHKPTGNTIYGKIAYSSTSKGAFLLNNIGGGVDTKQFHKYSFKYATHLAIWEIDGLKKGEYPCLDLTNVMFEEKESTSNDGNWVTPRSLSTLKTGDKFRIISSLHGSVKGIIGASSTDYIILISNSFGWSIEARIDYEDYYPSYKYGWSILNSKENYDPHIDLNKNNATFKLTNLQVETPISTPGIDDSWITPNKFKDFYDGQEFYGTIDGAANVRGKITIKGRTVYLCQDKKDGDRPRDLKGYKFGWSIGHPEYERNIQDYHVYDLKVKPKISFDVKTKPYSTESPVITPTQLTEAIQIKQTKGRVCRPLTTDIKVKTHTKIYGKVTKLPGITQQVRRAEKLRGQRVSN